MRLIKFLSTIRGRMVVLYSLLFTAAFVFISLFYSNIVANAMKEQQANIQASQVNGFAQEISTDLYNWDATALYSAARAAGEEFDARVLVLDNDGQVLADSYSELNGRALAYKEVNSIHARQTTQDYGYHKIQNQSSDGAFWGGNYTWAVYRTSAVVYKLRQVGIVLFSYDIQDLVIIINEAIRNFAMIALFLEVLLVVFSMMLSEWISRPIGRMTDVIREMSRGHFDRRINVKGSSEIAEMGKTFNMMSERLENQDRMRSEFVANASHELKTPLSAIKILTESLIYQDGVPESTYKEFLIDINDQIDRLGMLMTDLLELSQIERSETTLNYTTVNMKEFVGEAIERLQPIAEENDVTLIDNSSDIELECDKGKLSAALSNLLSNGLKYTHAGGKVRCTTSLTDDGDVSIMVTDTGIGIPHDDQAHIFERFYRVDKARSRDTGGTGLGLSIVQQVCRLHGGRVKVQSQAGKGSVFTMILPQRRWDV